jgi:hypothetical protein
MSPIAATLANTPTSPRPWMQTAALVACATLLFVPFVIFVVNQGSYLQTGHEALAYRYFFQYRLAGGEAGVLWSPQGWATAALQRMIFTLQALFIAPEAQLRQSIELFGALTTAGQSGLGVLLLAVAFRDRSLHVIEKAAIALALLIPLLCTPLGNYYWMLPDYYQLNMVLLAALVYCFSKAEGLATAQRWLTGAGLLGVYFGVVVANKVSLALPCLIPLIPIVFGTRPWKRVVGVLFACFGGALVGVILTVLVLYVPRWSLVGAAIGPWLAYVRAPGGDVALSAAFVETYLIPNNFHVLGLLCVATSLAVLALLWAFLGWRSIPLRQSVALTVLALAAPLPLVALSSGTTVFEIFLTLSAITMAQIALLASLRKGARTGWALGRAVAAAFVVFCGVVTIQVSPWLRMADTATRSGRRVEITWSLHRALRESLRPIVFITPNNDYRFFTVEEALLRGFSDFPTWSISTGQQGIDRIYQSRLSFRESGSSSNHPSAQYPSDAVLVWVDLIHPDYKRLPEQFPSLADAISRPGVSCRETPDPYDRYRRLTICTPAPARETFVAW